MVNQFGIKLEGSRRPIYICGSWYDQDDLRYYLKTEELVPVELAATGGRMISISGKHVVAICGPNKPFDSDLWSEA